jgi:hypothetical protein
MAGIAQNIERYNVAYKLAWKHISERQKREYPNVAEFLHDAIRRQLKKGAVEPLFIAAEALLAPQPRKVGDGGRRNSPSAAAPSIAGTELILSCHLTTRF